MNILKGEVRQVGIEIINQNREEFVIELADYTVKNNSDIVLDSGSAIIDNHKIITMFSSVNKETGSYYVEFTYRIGPEILKARIPMEVKK